MQSSLIKLDWDSIFNAINIELKVFHAYFFPTQSSHNLIPFLAKKPNEKLYFRTHVYWLQGSPENSVIKDVGLFYLSNKRLIFIGSEKSYSINFPKITNLKFGDNYA